MLCFFFLSLCRVCFDRLMWNQGFLDSLSALLPRPREMGPVLAQVDPDGRGPTGQAGQESQTRHIFFMELTVRRDREVHPYDRHKLL